MTRLRLTQTTLTPDHYYIQMALEEEGASRLTAAADLAFALTPQEQADLRWYFEDYLSVADNETQQIAARIEGEMWAIGARLFAATLDADGDARQIWYRIKDRLADVDIEIASDPAGAAAVPWELLRDPAAGVDLALRAQTFARSHANPANVPDIPKGRDEPLRILLVICRPQGDRDVPFRSVAGRIVRGLSADARARFELRAVRPPTFERTAELLRAAKEAGQPYHVLHFDGHGAFLDPEPLFAAREQWAAGELAVALLKELGLQFDPERFASAQIYPGARRAGAHGYLVFENPDGDDNRRLVDGPALGRLLHETGVALLALNACRSAYAEPPEAPEAAGGEEAAQAGPLSPHDQVRAFGSLAQEVMDAGAPAVAAMRYNVYVDTAARFMADLYAALVTGRTPAAAAQRGRRGLADDPTRKTRSGERALRDWPAPIIYEAAPFKLGQMIPLGKLKNPLEAAGGATLRGLPEPPDAGFFGRDETLLALDRAFDRHGIALLHGYAGAGKTQTAAEFARWYALTGGAAKVLFTGFQTHKTLAQALEDFGQAFAATLERVGVPWGALDAAAKRDMALQLFPQIPVLWIWDNVEPVAGFPAGTPSAWTAAEQAELRAFLRDAAKAGARLLLTSRRDEEAWLGDLPRRIAIPPLRMGERLELAQALADRRAAGRLDATIWRPLLLFTQGNPMTVTVVAGQALKDGLKTGTQIEAYVNRLRAGEAAFTDDVREGRDRSLGASLAYGFEHAFDDAERGVLALLHLFQGFVDVDALAMMGTDKREWGLPELAGQTRERLIPLLDRAAEAGLLMPHGGGYYGIHPAVPWFFRDLFAHHYPDAAGAPPPAVRATRAFVEALGALGNFYHDEFETGNPAVIDALYAEEANLLHARRLALAYGWHDAVIRAMQGLYTLYDRAGRRAEWRALVEEIADLFTDPATGGPRPGLEAQWSLVTQYRMRLAMELRQWDEAERLQRAKVEFTRRVAEQALDAPPESLDAADRNRVRTLAASLTQLGDILREQGKPACVEAYTEGYDLRLPIGDRPGAAVVAFNLGHAYLQIPALRDLDAAERWYERALELFDPRDAPNCGKALGQLGLVAHERFREARAAGAAVAELLRLINAAAARYHEALELTPEDDAASLATNHGQLGNIYGDAGMVELAMEHHGKCIRYFEGMGALYDAATTRFNAAWLLARAGRLADALAYARAARAGFAQCHNAEGDVANAQRLIEQIEADMRGSG